MNSSLGRRECMPNFLAVHWITSQDFLFKNTNISLIVTSKEKSSNLIHLLGPWMCVFQQSIHQIDSFSLNHHPESDTAEKHHNTHFICIHSTFIQSFIGKTTKLQLCMKYLQKGCLWQYHLLVYYILIFTVQDTAEYWLTCSKLHSHLDQCDSDSCFMSQNGRDKASEEHLQTQTIQSESRYLRWDGNLISGSF